MMQLSKNLKKAGDALIATSTTLVASAIITGMFGYKILNSDNIAQNIEYYKVIALTSVISTIIIIINLYRAGRHLRDCQYS